MRQESDMARFIFRAGMLVDGWAEGSHTWQEAYLQAIKIIQGRQREVLDRGRAGAREEGCV